MIGSEGPLADLDRAPCPGLPLGGAGSPSAYILPVLTLGIPFGLVLARLLRTSLLDRTPGTAAATRLTAAGSSRAESERTFTDCTTIPYATYVAPGMRRGAASRSTSMRR